MERQVRVLRSQFGPEVDAREAYADLLVVNASGGVGVTNLWLDDMELLGQIAATNSLRAARGAGPEAADPPRRRAGPDPARGESPVDGAVLLVEGHFLPGVIEQRGIVEWLRSLGINAFRLPAALTAVSCGGASGIVADRPPPNDGSLRPATTASRVDLGTGWETSGWN
jgi:hypothetical protein